MRKQAGEDAGSRRIRRKSAKYSTKGSIIGSDNGGDAETKKVDSW